MDTKRNSKYVCDIIGCNKQFSYLKCFESHRRNEHSIGDNKEDKPETNGAKDSKTGFNRNSTDNEWEQFVERREMDGKQRLLCRLCDFGHNLQVYVKQHIINSHLTQKRIRSRPKTHSDFEYWDKILFNKTGVRISGEPKPEPKTRIKPKPKAEPKPKSSTPLAKSTANSSPKKLIITPIKHISPKVSPKVQNISKPQIETKLQIIPKLKIDSEIMAKKHLQIDKSKSDVLLSCKGLASMTKGLPLLHPFLRFLIFLILS